MELPSYERSLADDDLQRRFTLLRSSIKDRFDSEPFAPKYRAYRRMIMGVPHARLDALATVIKPPGRYKTLYVDDEAFGIKLLSGRQIARSCC